MIVTKPELKRNGNMRRLASEACVDICYNRKTSRQEWLAIRREGVGGSDAAGVLGLSRYSSPLSVWMEKTGRFTRGGESEYTKWGNILEPLIRDQVAEYLKEVEGTAVSVYESPWMYRSASIPFMRYNPDGLIVEEKSGEIGLLEIKTTTELNRKAWGEDEVPDEYYCQVQHGLAVLGLPWAYVFVLIGKRLAYRFVPRNDLFIGSLTGREREFWQMVEEDTPPAPIGSDADDEALAVLGSPDTEDTVEDASLESLLEEYARIQDVLKEAEVERKRIQQAVKARLGTAKKLVAGSHTATWSRFTTSRFDMERFKKEKPYYVQQYSNLVESSRLLIR